MLICYKICCLPLQKSGINAKNDNVKVLGIRVREIMHERKIELLEGHAMQQGAHPIPKHAFSQTLSSA